MSVTAIGNLKLLYYFGSKHECGLYHHLYYSHFLFLTRNFATANGVDCYMIHGSEGGAPALTMMDEHKKFSELRDFNNINCDKDYLYLVISE